ncbi:MAG: lipoyl(octanoyl) transferase LipB, partial [Solirubrobacteraceae bacterium]
MPYADALALQEDLRARIGAGEAAETILLLEHPDVITYGRGAKDGHTRESDTDLRRLGYDVFRVNRGGDVTWHGPGQLIGYPLLDLAQHGQDVHLYLRALEGALIDALADFGIVARRREGYAGVWLDERRKIASIGVGLRRWLTLHGFALNVNCDLARFDVIVPCGLAGV